MLRCGGADFGSAQKMIRKAATVIAVTIVILLGAVPAWRQYHWASEATGIANADGWTLIASSDNYIDPVQPWTIFSQPVNTLVVHKVEGAAACLREYRCCPDTLDEKSSFG